MSLFGDALAGGLKTIRQLAGQPVVYSTGTLTLPIDLAVQISNELQSASSDVVLETVNVVDWSFSAAALLDDNGDAFEPASGHRITALLHGQEAIFEVVLVPGHQCFEYLDQDGSTLLVHTQRIS